MNKGILPLPGCPSLMSFSSCEAGEIVKMDFCREKRGPRHHPGKPISLTSYLKVITKKLPVYRSR